MTRFTFTLDCIIDYKHNTSSSARELQSVKAAERQAQQQCRAMAQAGLTLTRVTVTNPDGEVVAQASRGYHVW